MGSRWNSFFVNIPREGETEFLYALKVLDCLEGFYRKNTLSDPPLHHPLSLLRSGLEENARDGHHTGLGGNFCDMDLRGLEMRDSFNYEIYSSTANEDIPNGIKISCHHDEWRKRSMALLKLLWEDFELEEPISS